MTFLQIELKLIFISAVGAFCKLTQDVTSWNHSEGAAVAIDAIEYERERDDCPMYFDDGENPWRQSDASNIIFDWDFYKAGASRMCSLVNTQIMLTTLVGFIFLKLVRVYL